MQTWKRICSDLDLMALGMEYSDFIKLGQFYNRNLSSMVGQLLAANEYYNVLAIVCARISTDVE